jgi:NADPH:quinone reductase-like Zn-dependent oxidoreductase
MAEGKLIPYVERAYPLECAAQAFRLLEEGKVLGKLVLTLNEVERGSAR